MTKGEKVTHESSGLTKREWNELMTSFEFNKDSDSYVKSIFRGIDK
jgi:hypothetical protein